MPRGHVTEYTRQLANGTKVQVNQHTREFEGAAPRTSGGRTPVQAHRKAKEVEQRKAKRRKMRKKGLFQARRGVKRLGKAYKAAKKHKKATAAFLAVGGVLEIGAWATTQVVGVVGITLALAAAGLAGGLMLSRESRPGHRPARRR